jgi:hypothetical protein
MSDSVPKRRWFRLFLIVLTAALAAFAGWLGWNVNVVNQRRAARARYDIGFAAAEDSGAIAKGEATRKVSYPTAERSLSAIRRALGDEPAGTVLVFVPAQFEPTVALFPEALVALVEAKGVTFSPDKRPVLPGDPR